ncbi:MAG: ParB/RepB/Spo0J family partition protein [Lactobacillales bacterium]|jgi:ParB family chromosome partitioning protein|nr:ParB/RepB/Spo0J family partition protein [Lactobacillales bacterium]
MFRSFILTDFRGKKMSSSKESDNNKSSKSTESHAKEDDESQTVSNESSSPVEPSINTNSDPNTISISDTITSIDINKIEPDPEQPRKLFAASTLSNLRESINKTSLHNPIFVRETEQKPGFFIIVDGERRWRACKDLNLKEIPCRIVLSDLEGYKTVALTQNLQREDLLPIEKANAFANLLARLKGSDENAKQKSLVGIVNLSENYISEMLKISKLDEQIKTEALQSKEWSVNKLLQLARIKNHEKRQAKFAEFKAIIDKKSVLPDKTADSEKSDSDTDAKATTSSSSDKKVASFMSRISAFRINLEKCRRIKFHPSELAQIYPELTAIQKLINEILT